MNKYILILISFVLSNNNLDRYSDELSLDNQNNRTQNSIIDDFDNNLFLEETINPEDYIVGPGDVFLFNMISTDGMHTLDLLISPLGKVLIPNIGDIYIDKMTLSKAFETIKSRCLKTYSNAKINLALHNIRQFKVQVVGPVYKPGNVIVSPIMRISDVYDAVKYPDENQNLDISTRNIKLIRNDIIYEVDLVNYYQIGNKTSNPYIRQGDIIKFKLKDSIVDIQGGIKIPGYYEFIKYEKLYDLINLAGGFSVNADSNYIYLTRFINDIDTKGYIFNDLDETRNFILEPNDYIHVRYKKDYKRMNTVKIDGEINYPGYYPYDDKTTIYDIIKMSGSYTSNADSNKIIINNAMIVDNIDTEYERIMQIDNNDRTASEKSYIKSRNKITRGLIISEDNERTQKIYKYHIEDGDSIYIPKLTNYVEIIGSVKFPGRYPYDRDMKIQDYIDEAGGKTKNATKNLFIIDNASNQKIKAKKRSRLDNGDILFIQSNEDFSPYNRFKEAMLIITQAATIFAVINNIK